MDDSGWVLQQLAIWPLAAVVVIVIIGLFGYSIKAGVLGTMAAIKSSRQKLAQVSQAARHRMTGKK
jgi:hypothetical protein